MLTECVPFYAVMQAVTKFSIVLHIATILGRYWTFIAIANVDLFKHFSLTSTHLPKISYNNDFIKVLISVQFFT